MKEEIKLTNGKIDDMSIEEIRKRIKHLESIVTQITEHKDWINSFEIKE